MKKSELTWLKKQLGDEDFARVNVAYSALFDINKQLITDKKYDTYDFVVADYFNENAKKVAGGTFGKKISEFTINPNNHPLNDLYNNIQDYSVEEIRQSVQELIKNYNLFSKTLITINCCEVVKTNKVSKEGVGERIRFLFINFSEPKKEKLKITFNTDTNESSFNTKSLSFEEPYNAIIFPSLSDGEIDINNAMYYTKNAKYSSREFVENIIQGNFLMTSDEEKEKFVSFISNLEEDLSYEQLYNLNVILTKLKKDNETKTTPERITKHLFKKILKEIDYEIKEDEFEEKYDEIIGKNLFLLPECIVDSSISIKTDLAVIKVNLKNMKDLAIENINGGECLAIPLGGDDVFINDIRSSNLK